jgi:hypothetical protein
MLRLFLTVVTLIVVVFVAQILIKMQDELSGLKAEIALLTQEPVTAVDFAPFAPLDENCTQCHSERRFMGMHGSETDIQSIVDHMEMQADLALSPEDVDRVHAAMNLLKCAECHDEAALKKFAALNTSAQQKVLKRMETIPGSILANGDLSAIQRSVRTIQGF